MKTYIDTKEIELNGEQVTAYKVAHDSNGNPRWVVHFLDLLSTSEQDAIRTEVMEANSEAPAGRGLSVVPVLYARALAKAKTVHGRKYTAKWFGGGIVFQSYNIAGELKEAFESNLAEA